MTDVKESAARFIRAFNAHDENAMRNLNASNHTLTAPGDIKLQGRDTTGYALEWIKACPDGKLTVRNEIISGPWVVEEVTFEGTQQGALAGPSGSIPATGKRLAIQSVIITRYENDMAVETKLYFDQSEVFKQLGVTQSPDRVPATV
jgi:predicted ester cyclase